METKNPRKELVDTIIESMKNRDGGWQKTWTNLSAANAPYNPITGTKYSGVNFIALSLGQTELNTQDPRWCTFKQATEVGYTINKGAKSAQASFYDLKVKLTDGEKDTFITAKSNNEYISKIINHYKDAHPDKAAEIKKALVEANAEKSSITSDKARLALFVYVLNKETGSNTKLSAQSVMKTFPIFNYSQLQNVPELEVKQPVNQFEPIRRAEGILVASGAKIFHDQANGNYYNNTKHEIHLTSRESFKSPEAYYSTALHEMAHWTEGDGVARHLKTDETNNVVDLAYVREELRAELSSMFMSSDLNLKPDIQNHSAYLGSYLKILNDDYNEFFAAVSDAQKISTHVMGFEKRLDLESSESIELETKNPELYQKIIAFNAQTAALDSTQIKSDSTYNFKVGDTYIGKSHDEAKKYEIKGVGDNTVRVVNKASDIGQEYTSKAFQGMLDAYDAKKLDNHSPRVSINPNYLSLAKEVLHNDFFSKGQQNAEHLFMFTTPKSAQAFIDKLTTEHDVPGNMIQTSNFARHDKTPSYIMSRGESVQQQADPNKAYLERFFEEKKVPFKQFTVKSGSETHIVDNNVVISYLINSADSKTQGEVQKILTELDFKNADINHFLEHCATAVVKQYEAIREMGLLDSTNAHEFKKNEIEHELENEPKAQKIASLAKPTEEKEKSPKVENKSPKVEDKSIDDDNDFSR